MARPGQGASEHVSAHPEVRERARADGNADLGRQVRRLADGHDRPGAIMGSQGLTEFLPVSSSAHLIIVPFPADGTTRSSRPWHSA